MTIPICPKCKKGTRRAVREESGGNDYGITCFDEKGNIIRDGLVSFKEIYKCLECGTEFWA